MCHKYLLAMFQFFKDTSGKTWKINAATVVEILMGADEIYQFSILISILSRFFYGFKEVVIESHQTLGLVLLEKISRIDKM